MEYDLLNYEKKEVSRKRSLLSYSILKAPVIGRYEREEATPSVEAASKLSKILGASLDYLVGNTSLELDTHTLKRIEDISKLPEQDRSYILRTMDALIRDLKAQKAYAS